MRKVNVIQIENGVSGENLLGLQTPLRRVIKNCLRSVTATRCPVMVLHRLRPILGPVRPCSHTWSLFIKHLSCWLNRFILQSLTLELRAAVTSHSTVRTHPAFPPPFRRVFPLNACHGSCCHLKLMNSNNFTACRHSVCMGLRSNWWQKLPERFLDCRNVPRIRGSRTIWKLLSCSAMMDHAQGMSAALDSVIVHPAWVRENLFSASIKRCCRA